MFPGWARASWPRWRRGALPDRLPGSPELLLPALAARAQLGDRAALEELLRRLQDPLRAHVRGIVGSDDAAADVLQETLVLVCRRLGTVRELRWVRAWAFRVATREAVRAARRQNRHRWEALDDWPDLPAPPAEEPALDAELLAQLPTRLASLPPGAQVVLRLHYLQELTQPEVAAALEIPLGTVKSRIAYGLAVLRRDWHRLDESG